MTTAVNTITDTAKILKVSRPTVQRLLDEKKLKGFKVCSIWRITDEAIEEFIKQGEAK